MKPELWRRRCRSAACNVSAHVALIGDNRPRLYAAAMAAAQWLGAVAVPLYQDATAEEMVAPLQKSEATHVFAENQSKSTSSSRSCRVVRQSAASFTIKIAVCAITGSHSS